MILQRHGDKSVSLLVWTEDWFQTRALEDHSFFLSFRYSEAEQGEVGTRAAVKPAPLCSAHSYGSGRVTVVKVEQSDKVCQIADVCVKFREGEGQTGNDTRTPPDCN